MEKVLENMETSTLYWKGNIVATVVDEEVEWIADGCTKAGIKKAEAEERTRALTEQ